MNPIEEKLKALTDAIVVYEHDKTLEIVRDLIALNVEPQKIIDDGLLIGIEIVKDKFEKLEYFLPELIFASEAMKASIDLMIESLPQNRKDELISGSVVIGTPKGDIHDVGKNIFGTLLMASGFKVYDIGIDRHVDQFIEKAEEVKADIIAVSCLMTTSLIQQKELVEDLTRLGLRNKYKVIFGGGAVQTSWAEKLGADGYSVDASSGVKMVKQLMSK